MGRLFAAYPGRIMRADYRCKPHLSNLLGRNGSAPIEPAKVERSIAAFYSLSQAQTGDSGQWGVVSSRFNRFARLRMASAPLLTRSACMLMAFARLLTRYARLLMTSARLLTRYARVRMASATMLTPCAHVVMQYFFMRKAFVHLRLRYIGRRCHKISGLFERFRHVRRIN